MTMHSSSALVETITSAPAGLYLMAFETRFSNARESRSGSARNARKIGREPALKRIPRCAGDRVQQQQRALQQRFGAHRRGAHRDGAAFQAGDVQVLG